MSKWVIDIHGELEGDYDIIKEYKEPKIGNWVRAIHTTERGILIPYCKCSECGKAIDITFCSSPFTYNYCPSCGAKMTESEG